MKLIPRLIARVIFTLLLIGVAGTGQARVMMSGIINQTTGFRFDVLETASFTIDDWLSAPNLWWLTIENSPEDSLTVVEAYIIVNIGSERFPGIIQDGKLWLIGPGGDYVRQNLPPGEKMIVDNTLVAGTNARMDGKWSEAFTDEALRIGSLPEGSYSLTFTLVGYYMDKSGGRIPFGENEVQPISDTIIEIQNPRPPELVTPENGSDDVVLIPRFSWQDPSLTTFRIKGRVIKPQILYTISVWKMFDDFGASLTQEQAIRRIPVWSREGISTSWADFDPGSAREDLVNGRRYCWQVQGFDGTGRYISSINEGKSEIWEFTVRFVPPVLNEPVLFSPLRFSWISAQAGGGLILYDVSVADNQDFSGAYVARGQALTRFTYPSDAPRLVAGRGCYIRIQATDEQGVPIGVPAQGSFSVPVEDLALAAPENNAMLSALNPVFRWRGSGEAYVATVFREESGWVHSSGRVAGNSWTYDGEPLERGATYSWQVALSDEYGEAAGSPTEKWRFTVPETARITLSAPVDQTVDSVFPVFSWDPLAGADEQVSYIIEITADDGSPVHSATISAASYEYPRTAAGLQYAARYFWSVRAQRSGSDIGLASAKAWFVTPFVPSGGGEPSLSEIDAALRQVLRDYPEFAGFMNMTAVSIQEKGMVMSPAQFLDLLGKYWIKSVNAK